MCICSILMKQQFQFLGHFQNFLTSKNSKCWVLESQSFSSFKSCTCLESLALIAASLIKWSNSILFMDDTWQRWQSYFMSVVNCSLWATRWMYIRRFVQTWTGDKELTRGPKMILELLYLSLLSTTWNHAKNWTPNSWTSLVLRRQEM